MVDCTSGGLSDILVISTDAPPYSDVEVKLVHPDDGYDKLLLTRAPTSFVLTPGISEAFLEFVCDYGAESGYSLNYELSGTDADSYELSSDSVEVTV